MFLWTEVRRQISRNKGRSVLLLCIAAVLTMCMAFYIWNMQSAQSALLHLGEELPVRVRITNLSGDKSRDLFINAVDADVLGNAGVRELRCTAAAAGSLTEKAQAQQPFIGGDTQILAANCVEAADISAEAFHFTDGYDTEFFQSADAVCVLKAAYAEQNGLSVGDTVTLPTYLYMASMGYEPLRESTVKIIGTYTPQEESGAPNILVPAAWLREEAGRAGLKYFSYTACNAVVDDPLNLHDFKTQMTEAGFVPIDPAANDYATGKGLIVEDELFMKTAGELKKNIALFQNLLVPFFVLLMGLFVLTTFLTMRGAKREMAIACSLGVSKRRCAMPNFLYAVLLNLLGCAVTLPILCAALRMPILYVLLVFGIFMVCAALGTAVALVCLLRFDTLTLLTQTD